MAIMTDAIMTEDGTLVSNGRKRVKLSGGSTNEPCLWPHQHAKTVFWAIYSISTGRILASTEFAPYVLT